MTIHIENLQFKCIIGILDFERENEQEVIVNLALDYTFHQDFINYAHVANQVKSIMKENQFLLIEDALEEISSTLKAKYTNIEKLFLKITKPSILPDCMVSVSETYIIDS